MARVVSGAGRSNGGPERRPSGPGQKDGKAKA